MTDITAKLVTVTPALAAQLIEKHNGHNRSVSQARVEQYAADMRRGDWTVNGEAVKIGRDGRVLDGQHRLLACLEADIGFQTLLITGLEAAAQETMDQGKARTFDDVLKLRGEKGYHMLAAATRLVCIYERDGMPVTAGFCAAPSNQMAARTLERNPGIRDSCALARKLNRAWLTTSTAAGLHYLFSIADAEGATAFLTTLATGENLAASSPVYILRERLIAEHYSLGEARMPAKVKMALVIKAWNAYQDGTPIARLKWVPGGAHPEKFPSIRGLATGPTDDDEEAAAA